MRSEASDCNCENKGVIYFHTIFQAAGECGLIITLHNCGRYEKGWGFPAEPFASSRLFFVWFLNRTEHRPHVKANTVCWLELHYIVSFLFRMTSYYYLCTVSHFHLTIFIDFTGNQVFIFYWVTNLLRPESFLFATRSYKHFPPLFWSI